MLSQAIGSLLPLAIGVALSPIPIIAVILMLGTPKAHSNGPAFALGWVAGLVIVNVIVLVVVGDSSTADSTTSTTQDWIRIIFGVLFLALAAKQWRGRPKAGEEAVMPAWMTTIDAFSTGKSFGFGILLSGVNPKNLALTLAAASSIAQAGLSGSQTTVAVLVFVVIGSLTVAGPVVYYLLATDRAAKPLATIKQFMSEHNAVIMMVVLLVLGAKLIGDGIAALG